MHEMDQNLPDLADYHLHRVVEDAPVWGVEVPGLRASYWRRDQQDGRTATAGLFSYQGVPVFLAWGYTDERHCRFHAFRTPDGRWEQPRSGCPRVRAERDGGTVTGLLLRTRSGPHTLAVQPASVAVSTSAVRADRRTAAMATPVNVSAVTNSTACSTGLMIGTNPITATGS
jgi:hypothetical protein